MNTIIENTAKFLVSAMLATFATVLFGGMVAVSAGTTRAADAAQQGQHLQA
jgi:ABC-type antimicrobial peptide transport system permease subunit